MLHECNVHCQNLDLDNLESLGIHSEGKWLPFCFFMEMVDACKLTSDEPESMVYNCTTLFTAKGEMFIIDTPFEEFKSLLRSSAEDDPGKDLEYI